jgi:hypothetical protein
LPQAIGLLGDFAEEQRLGHQRDSTAWGRILR